MKNRIFTVIIISMITSIYQCYADNNYRVISQASLNVRESTSTESEIIGTYHSGQEIEVKSVKDGWAKVNYNGRAGYVMVDYIQPLTNSQSPSGSNTNDIISTLVSSNPVSSKDEDPFESERKTGMYEISYCATTFDEVKLSGSYGLGWTMLPWKVAPQLYAGIHFSPLNFNYGLVDSEYASSIIKLGPAIGYYFTPKILVSIPLDVLCEIYTDSEDKTKTNWGLSLAPKVYIGNKGGVFLGPQFTIAFVSDSEVSCGFRAGIYF